jgi:hypothetical protein
MEMVCWARVMFGDAELGCALCVWDLCVYVVGGELSYGRCAYAKAVTMDVASQRKRPMGLGWKWNGEQGKHEDPAKPQPLKRKLQFHSCLFVS